MPRRPAPATIGLPGLGVSFRGRLPNQQAQHSQSQEPCRPLPRLSTSMTSRGRFATPTGRERWETRARANLTSELATLR